LAKRRKLDPANTSLLGLCVALGGYRKGARVALFIMQWSILAHEMNREPLVVEYVDEWREAERSVRRHLAEFRDLFPDYDTPQPFVSALPAAKKAGDAFEAYTAAATAKVPRALIPDDLVAA
jgi:hypothetical protein